MNVLSNSPDIAVYVENKEVYPDGIYRADKGSSGYDFRNAEENIAIRPMERRLISLGFRVGMPHGYELQLRPRSGLAYKHGLTVLNTPATIDASYNGIVKVLLINLGSENVLLNYGERICQGVFMPVAYPVYDKIDNLTLYEVTEEDYNILFSNEERGEGGFGSTGTK